MVCLGCHFTCAQKLCYSVSFTLYMFVYCCVTSSHLSATVRKHQFVPQRAGASTFYRPLELHHARFYSSFENFDRPSGGDLERISVLRTRNLFPLGANVTFRSLAAPTATLTISNPVRILFS